MMKTGMTCHGVNLGMDGIGICIVFLKKSQSVCLHCLSETFQKIKNSKTLDIFSMVYVCIIIEGHGSFFVSC